MSYLAFPEADWHVLTVLVIAYLSQQYTQWLSCFSLGSPALLLLLLLSGLKDTTSLFHLQLSLSLSFCG